MRRCLVVLLLLCPALLRADSFDVVIVGGTPGGIMAAIAAARNGRSVVLLERTKHIGGLPANGLGATDIHTRGATGGLFMQFVGRIKRHYETKYGPMSEQVKACSEGYRFEPHIAEQIFEAMLSEHKDKLAIRRQRQFEAEPENIVREKDAKRPDHVMAILVTDRVSGKQERYDGRVFIDATYEGDLAAAAGADYHIGREGKAEFREPFAGRLYKHWGGEIGSGSDGRADNAVQAYNYRLCLTRDPADRVAIVKPTRYNRAEFADLADDVRLNRTTGKVRSEMDWEGIGRVVNMVPLPNGKTDANNQHLAFLSTDLPEENWPWPTSGWDWRDRFAARQRDYTLGLLWFLQNDDAVPEAIRKRAAEWGLSKSEYADNGHFPRQVYVREGRRIVGEEFFTAWNALPRAGSKSDRPPHRADSITASHYALDSHAVRKREAGRVHLDGFFSGPTKPYSVPYGVMVPMKLSNVLTPVPVSGTHIGFSTLRMEPCWMALGEAAGEAAAVSVEEGSPVNKVNLPRLQRQLIQRGAVLVYFPDAKPSDPHYPALQWLALHGVLPEWKARLNDRVTAEEAEAWIKAIKAKRPEGYTAGKTTRGELMTMLRGS